MADFINTIDALGDDVVIDSFIDRSIAEFKDDIITTISANTFRGCSKLNDVDLPNATTMGLNSFDGCPLANLNLPKITTVEGYSFSNAGSASQKVCFPSVTTVSYDGFRNALFKHIDLPVCTLIRPRGFYCAGNLETLILRSNTVCTGVGLEGNWTGNTPQIARGNGYVYVPSALIDSYKETYAGATWVNQFRALEDYTVDGTTTGELDETKI